MEEIYNYLTDHVNYNTDLELMSMYNIGKSEHIKKYITYNIEEKLNDKVSKHSPKDKNNNGNPKADNERNHRTRKCSKSNSNKNKGEYRKSIRNDRKYNYNTATYVQTTNINKFEKFSKKLPQMPSESCISNSEQPI
jgi:hypothetical protein